MARRFRKTIDHNPGFNQFFERIVELSNEYVHNLKYGAINIGLRQNSLWIILIPSSTAPGIAWGCHRSVLPNGFYDKHILKLTMCYEALFLLGDIFNAKLLLKCQMV